MLIPLGVDVPRDRRPWMNYLLVASISVVSVMALNDEELFADLAGLEKTTREVRIGDISFPQDAYEFNPRPIMYPVHAVTSCFAHAGLLHLVGNMLFLWIFGNAVNYKFGHLGYVGLFLLAAVASGVCHYATSDLAAVGASGAINGVMGAFLVFFPRNNVRVLWWVYIYARYFVISSIWVILMWLGWDVFYIAVGAETGVAHWAHVGGFLSGFVVALLLAWLGLVHSDADEQTLLELVGISRQ